MLALAHVDSFYDRSHILHDICLDVPEGKVTAVLGRNGTGKTTLLKTSMGLTDRMDGEIRLDETDLGKQPTFRRARAGIAYVPQGRESSGFLDPRKHPDGLVCPRRRQARDTEARRRAVSLSDGHLRPQWRRALRRPAATARHRARTRCRAEDHPARRAERGGIRPSIVEEIQNVIIRLNRDIGLTVVLVEQNVSFVRRAAHRFAMMEKGRVVEAGEIGDLSDAIVHRHMAV